jgi:predicted heme/steroid binding protein
MKIQKIVKYLTITVILFSILLPVTARLQYAQETGQSCDTCHINSQTGELNEIGKAFRESHTWPPSLRPTNPYLTFFFGFIHILSAVTWIGAIIFVHLIHTPHMVAAGGAPRKELVLGWTGMFGVLLSGIYLTFHRFGGIENLLSSPAGKVVLFKVGIFAVMASTALILTFYLNRQLKKIPLIPRNVDLEELKEFSLKEVESQKGDKVLVVVGGLVYDVTESKLWKNGIHAARHEAWRDLSKDIKRAPHGPNVLEKFRLVGYTGHAYEEAKKAGQALTIFRLMAIMNLILGILAILLSSYLRWIA